MNFANIVNVAKSVGAKALLKVRKISPELALGAGIVLGVGAIVTAVMAGRKVDEVNKNFHESLDIVEEKIEAAEENEELTPEEKKEFKKLYRREALDIYKTTAIDYGKLFGPSVVLGVAAGAFILTSHGILKNRYLSSVAAYKALDEAYKSYRRYVAEDLGYGEGEKAIAARAKSAEGFLVEDENSEVAKHEKRELIQGDTKSPYEFDFNRNTSCCWDPDPTHVEMMLRREQQYFNDILNVRGYVFLNEVLDRLGMKRTTPGQILGWSLGRGDNYIDFGYLPGYVHDMRIDEDLCRKNIRLNFNCDGNILDDVDIKEREQRSLRC